MSLFKRIKVLLAAALFLVSAGYIATSKQSPKDALDLILQQNLKSHFQKKEMKEIYLSGPQKTHNVCMSPT